MSETPPTRTPVAPARPDREDREERPDGGRSPSGRRRSLANAPSRAESRAPDERVKVLYIAGIGRSGSTLLARALGGVDGLVAAGEVMHFFGRGLVNNELCACGSPVRDCPLWGSVAEGLRDGGGPLPGSRLERLRHRVTEGRHLPALLSPIRTGRFEEKLGRIRRRLGSLYGELRRASGARAVVDSSKNAGYARLLRDTPGVELHLVHLVRDSRGVAHSLGKAKPRPGVPWDGGRELLDRRGPGLASVFWSAAQLMVESMRGDAASYRRVRYRDFVRRPEESLRSILRQADEPRGEEQLSHVEPGAVELEPQHILAGNPMRSRHGRVDLEEDLDWREEMGRAQRGLVTALTWPLLYRYGYLPAGASGGSDEPGAAPDTRRPPVPKRERAHRGGRP